MKQEPIENLIVIHPHLLQKFMRYKKDFANLLALYTFYLYHAKNQKTNQPLATDEFTKRGMNWALDRVKKTKKILKEMKLIEVVQHKKYSYIHIVYIYTKEKVKEIFKNVSESEPKDLAPKKKKPQESAPMLKTNKEEVKSLSPLLNHWLEYCTKNKIFYNANNIKHWEEKLKNRISIEQQKAIYEAIHKKWKDFYMIPIKESKYHHLLGQSLMMDKDCDTLLDIIYKNEKYTYQFKNLRVTTTALPLEIFERHGYYKEEIKTAPIVSKVKDEISKMIKRF